MIISRDLECNNLESKNLINSGLRTKTSICILNNYILTFLIIFFVFNHYLQYTFFIAIFVIYLQWYRFDVRIHIPEICLAVHENGLLELELGPCVPCQQAKITRHIAASVEKFAAPSGRFEHIHLDIIVMPTSEGKRYCLTCIDRFTHWPKAFPMEDQEAETVARVFYEG